MKHDTVKMKIDGEDVKVDKGIAPLVEILYSLGYETLGSCEGGRGLTYVLFNLESIPETLFLRLRELTTAIEKERETREKGGNTLWWDFNVMYFKERELIIGRLSIQTWISQDPLVDKKRRINMIESLVEILKKDSSHIFDTETSFEM